MLRRFTNFILQGRSQALAVAFVCGFIPLLNSVSMVLAAFITLRKGVFEGALVTLAAILPYVIGYLGAPNQTVLSYGAILIAIASTILTWLFAVLLQHYGKWTLVLEAAIFLGVIAVVLVHVSHPDIISWWSVQLTEYFDKTRLLMEQMGQDAELTRAIEEQAVGYLKWYATGLFVISVMFNALLQLLLARWWQAIFFNPGGLKKELYQIRLGFIVGSMFVVSLMLTYGKVHLAMDSISVFYAMFALAGLSLMHYLFGIRKNGWIGIVVIYIAIIGFFPGSAILVAFVGLLDTFFNFRLRLQRVSTR